MYSKSIIVSLAIFSLFIMLASTAHGRNGPGDYWVEIMKAQPMPEALKDLLNSGPIENKDDFEPRPNVSVYHDDVKPKGVDCKTEHQDGPEPKKSFKDDFEPRPNVSVYND